MADPILLIAASCGMAAAAGGQLVLVGLRGRPPRLDDALGRLFDDPTGDSAGQGSLGELRPSDGDLASRIGAWAFIRLRLPLGDRTRRILALQGRSIGDFFAEKMVYAVLAGHPDQARDVVAAWPWNLRRHGQVRARRKAVRAMRTVSDHEVRELQVGGSARLSAFVRGQIGNRREVYR